LARQEKLSPAAKEKESKKDDDDGDDSKDSDDDGVGTCWMLSTDEHQESPKE
jgi:hypothetical protein